MATLFWVFCGFLILGLFSFRASLTGVSTSRYLQQKILEHVLRNVAYTSPTTVYLALFTALPSDETSGTPTEVSGGSYARQSIAFSAYANDAPTGGHCSNSGTITFPTASATWGTIVAIGIYDASTAGNLLYYGNLSANQIINNGQVFELAAADLPVYMD